MNRLPGQKKPLSAMTVIFGLFAGASALMIPACGSGGSSQPTLIDRPSATPTPTATPASSPASGPTPPPATPAPPSATPVPTPSPTPAPSPTVNIPVVGMSFGASVIVKAGSHVTWVNQSALLHSVIWDSRTPADAPPPGPNLATFAGGASSSVWVAPAVKVKTEYSYHCGIHGLMMSGKITVTP